MKFRSQLAVLALAICCFASSPVLALTVQCNAARMIFDFENSMLTIHDSKGGKNAMRFSIGKDGEFAFGAREEYCAHCFFDPKEMKRVCGGPLFGYEETKCEKILG